MLEGSISAPGRTSGVSLSRADCILSGSWTGAATLDRLVNGTWRTVYEFAGPEAVTIEPASYGTYSINFTSITGTADYAILA